MIFIDDYYSKLFCCWFTGRSQPSHVAAINITLFDDNCRTVFDVGLLGGPKQVVLLKCVEISRSLTCARKRQS